MKVFLVSTGRYSEYAVRGIFSTEEKALYAKKYWNSENDIEPFELDALPEHPKDCFFFQVAMDRNGNFDRAKSSPLRQYCGFSESGVSPCEPDAFARDYRLIGLTNHWMFYVWAHDETHAIKIANERRTALIATGKWDAK